MIRDKDRKRAMALYKDALRKDALDRTNPIHGAIQDKLERGEPLTEDEAYYAGVAFSNPDVSDDEYFHLCEVYNVTW